MKNLSIALLASLSLFSSSLALAKVIVDDSSQTPRALLAGKKAELNKKKAAIPKKIMEKQSRVKGDGSTIPFGWEH